VSRHSFALCGLLAESAEKQTGTQLVELRPRVLELAVDDATRWFAEHSNMGACELDRSRERRSLLARKPTANW
jgi:hypothetical protein